MGTIPYTLRLDETLKRDLEHEAALDDRPAAQLAAIAIKSMISARRAKREAIDAAIAEADKGSFISHQAMMSWIDTWDQDDEAPAPTPDIHR